MDKNYNSYSYFIIISSIAALGFAYILELFDIYPCRLCMYQRYIYYGLIFFSLSIVLANRNLSDKFKVFLEWIVYCLFMGGIGLGVFQVLIEKQLIKYESSCTTTIGDISSPQELFSSIQSKDLVACDVPQIEIFNLSLAGWNVLYMLLALCLSLVIMYKRGKSL